MVARVIPSPEDSYRPLKSLHLSFHQIKAWENSGYMKVVLSSLLEISLSYFGDGANHFLSSCKSVLESLLAGYDNSNYIKSIDIFSSLKLYG